MAEPGQIIFFWCLILGLGLLITKKASGFMLPLSIILILTGFIVAEFYTDLGFETGLRWQGIRSISYLLVLPIVEVSVLM